jgi:hypothetical protein
MTRKAKRPADVAASAGPRELDHLAREISATNSPKPAELQAPDSRVESDFDYFRAHPGAATRTRLAFPGEFTPADLAEGGGLDCFVIAIVERASDGRPTRRARWLQFCQGGNA